MAIALTSVVRVPARTAQRSVAPPPSPRRAVRAVVIARSGFKDAVAGGWLDLTRLVASATWKKSAYEELSSTIGKECYVDVGGWRLYLRDMSTDPSMPGVSMATAIANSLGPKVNQRLSQDDLRAFLQTVPVVLGKGKATVSLDDVMPSGVVANLEALLNDYARRQ